MTRLGLGGVLLASAALAAAQPPPRQPFEQAAVAAPRNTVDEAVFDRLARLRLTPARPASDAVFLRRVYLDAIGTLPTAEEARAFLDDASPSKRSALIDAPAGARGVRRLLGDEVGRRAPGEVRVPDQPVAERGAGLPRWIRAGLRDNMPYDQFARERCSRRAAATSASGR